MLPAEAQALTVTRLPRCAFSHRRTKPKRRKSKPRRNRSRPAGVGKPRVAGPSSRWRVDGAPWG
eukprot:5186905-Alexandrium_andersonii.AAC.1